MDSDNLPICNSMIIELCKDIIRVCQKIANYLHFMCIKIAIVCYARKTGIEEILIFLVPNTDNYVASLTACEALRYGDTLQRQS